MAGGLDGVDDAEGEAEEAVVVFVFDEGVGDGGGELDGLSGGGGAAYVDGVVADGAGCTAAVAVGNVPRGAFVFFEGEALAWVKYGMVATVVRWESVAEDPPSKN